ncbi:MAG: sensor histidine kinase [Ilumatobacteraceae bacterium]
MRVDLAILAADACIGAVAAVPDRHITLDAAASVPVDGVRDHLRQAIANLVSNAVTHTPAGTAIEVATRVADNRAMLTVRDHRAGLSGEALQHAFDRFWRAAPSRVGPKAGLGLSIVAAIAASHGGTVTVANQPDGGAIFTLDLPVATDSAPASARTTET